MSPKATHTPCSGSKPAGFVRLALPGLAWSSALWLAAGPLAHAQDLEAESPSASEEQAASAAPEATDEAASEAPAVQESEPTPAEDQRTAYIRQDDAGYQLIFNGEPYFIEGYVFQYSLIQIHENKQF